MPNHDLIVGAIETTQDMLSRLKVGLISGEPLQELEQLAKDMSLAALGIETMVSHRYEQGRGKIV
jgi:hypothetical protein